MKRTLIGLLLLIICIVVVIIVVLSGRISANFKQIDLSPTSISANENSTLVIDVQNRQQDKSVNGIILFNYPSQVTVTKDGQKITSYPFDIEAKGTLGEKRFSVSGQFVSGQLESPWTINVSIQVNGQEQDKKQLTLTVTP